MTDIEFRNHYKEAVETVRFEDDTVFRLKEEVFSAYRSYRYRRAAGMALIAVCVILIIAAGAHFILPQDTGNMKLAETQILPGETAVIKIEEKVQKGDVLTLSGHFAGENLQYSAGYIDDEEEISLRQNADSANISCSMLAEDSETNEFYLTNSGSETVRFQGNIEIKSNNLIRERTKKNSIDLKKGDVLRLSVSGKMIDEDHLEGLYVVDCDEQTILLLGRDTGSHWFEVTEDGKYKAFALMDDGELIELTKYLYAEKEAHEGFKESEVVQL